MLAFSNNKIGKKCQIKWIKSYCQHIPSNIFVDYNNLKKDKQVTKKLTELI
jgi:hypothetical protein